uniref:PDZ domain-containing protein n=1 Tax=Branchiostoma floridae TaxID=7739 RepID=C3ZT91_BRAFL|eukprot:XP_002588286.1 hypothetical protein BRAFLDRAFT_86734 [Branchiostoma floridae]
MDRRRWAVRRKLVLNRIRGEPFGFELQTYGIHHRGSPELELCTYVSRVYDDSPAFYCGLTPGDVILSVNGSVVAHADHQVVVKLIRQAGNKLSLIVLFENCIKKVELEVKLLQIKRLLFKKELELRALVMKEKQILEGVTETDKGRWSDATSTGSSTRSDRSLHYSAESREVLDSFTQISLHDSDHDNIQPSSLPPNQPKVVHLAQHKCEDASSLKHRRTCATTLQTHLNPSVLCTLFLMVCKRSCKCLEICRLQLVEKVGLTSLSGFLIHHHRYQPAAYISIRPFSIQQLLQMGLVKVLEWTTSLLSRLKASVLRIKVEQLQN